jgi:hypothetical protein
MTDSMFPMIRQMHDADTHARRAEILLECPVILMIKYRHVFLKACEVTGFQPGVDYLEQFAVALHQTRHRGNLKSAGLSHATGHLILIAEGSPQ